MMIKKVLPLHSALMHMWPPCSSNWPLGILPVPCTSGPFPAAPAGLCTTHAHFHHLPASPGHHSSKNRQQLQEVVLTFHVWEVSYGTAGKRTSRPGCPWHISTFLYGPDNRKRCPCTSQLVSEGHLSALTWPLTGAYDERAGWSTSWQKPAWAYPLSVLQGWFHLVTPSDSTLCTERVKVSGEVHRVFYLIIFLRRKA